MFSNYVPFNPFIQNLVKTGLVLGSLFIMSQTLQAGDMITNATAKNTADNTVYVTMDHAKLVPLKREARSIIVGNPSIATVSLYNKKTLLLTGKSFGRTNLIVLDENGMPLLDTHLGVKSDYVNTVVVHRGTSSASYDCSSTCSAKVVVGDDATHTKGAIESVQQRVKFVEAMSK